MTVSIGLPYRPIAIPSRSVPSALLPSIWKRSPIGLPSVVSIPSPWSPLACTGFPFIELLERRGFRVYLVDARAVAKVDGRPKTDIHDCQWIQRLHSYGLLEKAFRPQDDIVVLRGFVRQRQTLISYASQHIQHMQKALVLMNLKLTLVVSDIVGKTGMAIIKAILAGERDPVKLANGVTSVASTPRRRSPRP